MLKRLRRRRELVLSEANKFMEAYGNAAYAKARDEAREARKRGDCAREKFLGRVRQEIAKRTDFEIGLDTATRRLDDQTPYDAGPGFVRKAGTTLH